MKLNLKLKRIYKILLFLLPFILEFGFTQQIDQHQSFIIAKNIRQLQNAGQKEQQKSQPFRIKFDFDKVENESNISEETKNILIKALNAASFYIQNLLKVIPDKDPISLDPKHFSMCNDSPTSSKVLAPNSVKDVDLFIMVVGYFNSTITNLAKANQCFFKRRPQVGRININFSLLNINKIQNKYDYIMKLFVHEIIHILGFSSSIYTSWIDPTTNKQYSPEAQKSVMTQVEINGNKLMTLSTQLVKQQFQTHYACTDIPGIFLDNNSNNSHWLQNIIRDELMNLVIYNQQSDVTQFTTTLLKNTYYYSEVNENMAIHSGWGYKKGCQYFKNNIISNDTTPKSIDSQCDPAGYGKYSQTYKLAGKNGLEQSKNIFCTQLNKKSSTISGEEFSENSKCYSSSFRRRTIYNPFYTEYRKTRCFKTSFLEDGTLQLSAISDEKQENISFSCEYPSKYIEFKYEKNFGFIRCPSNLQLYKQKKLFCNNDCSLNGFCLKGRCVCQPGFGGENCSQNLEKAQVIYQNQKQSECPNGTFLNPNNVCMSDCQEGYFGIEKVCQKCHSKCSKCSGPASNNCLKCNLDFLLFEGKCLEKEICPKEVQEKDNCFIWAGKQCTACMPNYYLASNSQCQKCNSNCEQCFKNSDFCIKCRPGFILTENKCISLNEIQIGCEFIHPNDRNICMKCKENYYLTESKQCEFCEKGFYYDLDSKACEQCDKECLTCTYKSDFCTSCLNEYFFNIKANKCIKINKVEQSLKRNLVQLELEEDQDIFYYDDNSPCHFSCDICNGKQYSQCLQCSLNRDFIQSKSISAHFCTCPNGSSDYGIYGCLYDWRVVQIKFVFITLVSIGLFQQLYKVLFEQVIDFFQIVSYLRFVDDFYQLSLDEFWKSLQFSNMFNIQVIFIEETPADNLNINPKILFEDKTPYFICDTIILVSIFVVLNVLYLLKSKIQFIGKQENIKRLKDIIIIFNILSIQEIVFNICSNFMLISFNQSLTIINIIIGFVMLIFVILQFLYFFNQLHKEEKETKKEEFPNMSVKIIQDQEQEFINLQNKNSVSNLNSQTHLPFSSKSEQNSLNAGIQLNFMSVLGKQDEINETNSKQNIQQPTQNIQSTTQQITQQIRQQFQMKSQIGNLVFVITKILCSVLFSISHKNPKITLIFINIFVALRFISIFYSYQINKKTKILFTVKQFQLVAIITVYIYLLYSPKNSVIEIVTSSIMILLTIVDFIFLILFNIMLQIYQLFKYWCTKKQ